MISDHSWQLIRPEPLYNLFSISPKLPSKRHFPIPVIINVYRFKYYKYKTALKCDFPYLHTYPSIYSLHTSIILIVLHTMPMHKHLIWAHLNLQRNLKRTKKMPYIFSLFKFSQLNIVQVLAEMSNTWLTFSWQKWKLGCWAKLNFCFGNLWKRKSKYMYVSFIVH